jgi:uncharacterized delta-60 repeat protein
VDASLDIGSGPESITAAIDVGTVHIPAATNPAQLNVVLPLANGQILAGGNFSHFNKVARKLLVRLNANGSVDTSFNQGTGFEGDNVGTLVLTPNGKIMVGGKFTKINGSPRNVSLVRLNADGSLDTTFVDSTISYGASVGACSLQPDGKVLINAAYANSSFQATLQVYRLEANGGLDGTFMQGTGTPAVAAGLRHGQMPNGQVLLAGGSGLYNGVTVNSALFRVNTNGTVDASYAGYTLGLVNTGGLIGRFLPGPKGTIYFSGAFDKVGGQARLGLARLFPDGTLDPAFVPGVPVSPSPGALDIQPDGKLLVGSTTVVGTETKYLVSRLNGSGAAPTQGPQIGGISLQPGGLIQLMVGGDSTRVVIQSSSSLSGWSPLATNSVVNGLVTFTDPMPAGPTAKFYRLLAAP